MSMRSVGHLTITCMFYASTQLELRQLVYRYRQSHRNARYLSNSWNSRSV